MSASSSVLLIREDINSLPAKEAFLFHFLGPGEGFNFARLEHSAVSNAPESPMAHVKYRASKGMHPDWFGILMVNQLVDEVLYNDAGNEALRIKRFPRQAAPASDS